MTGAGDIRIFAVDDDPHLLETLLEQLGAEEGIVAEGVGSASLARIHLPAFNPDLVLLDVGLPDADGRMLCREFRKAGFTKPILMLTAQDSETDTIDGLEAGANDYISKPVRMGELMARIRSHLRQHQARDDAKLPIGAFDFLAWRKTLTHRISGKSLILTEKEAAILKYLFRQQGGFVSKEELLEQVWGYNTGLTTHTLETHIYRLRQKISQLDDAPLLLTRRGGYGLSL